MNNYIPTAEPKATADGVPVYCAHDAIVDVAKLVPNPKNPNKHPDEQIQLLGRIIRQTGWRQPITVSTRSGFIVKGHGRLAASLLEGVKEVPVDYQNYASEAEEYADLVADNRIAELAEIDNRMLADIFADIDTGEIPLEMTGFTEEEVEDLITGLSEALHQEELTNPDDVPEEPDPEDVITEPGDLWIIGRHRLLCGDSTDRDAVEQLMAGEKADMVFTDPPYGVSYTGGLQFKDGKAEKNNREMIKNDDIDLYDDVFRILAEFSNGACYVWFADTKAATLYNAAEKYGEIHALIIWVKNGGYGALNANYKQKHEPCLYWKPKNCKLNFVGATTETTVWEINKDGVNEYHPTQKPVALPIKAISNHEAEQVLDLFGGSGSTLIACEQLNRSCYTMELDPKYCDVIAKRYTKTTGKQDIRLIRNGKEMGREYLQSLFSE